jgi:hypothetical protein
VRVKVRSLSCSKQKLDRGQQATNVKHKTENREEIRTVKTNLYDKTDKLQPESSWSHEGPGELPKGA